MSDLIEKQAVIDALLSKMDTIDDKPDVVLGMAVAAGMIKDMPSALEQEPCDDAISRQAIINVFPRWKFVSYEAYLSSVVEIKKLPSVTSAEKVGEWEWNQYDANPNIGNWHCSECNRIVCGAITAVNPVYSYKYCPQCGCKMQEGEE